MASLYSAAHLRQETSIFAIGLQCNANGSKKWDELQAANDWDSCVAMVRAQVAEGAHAFGACTAFVGRDELPAMWEVIPRFTCSANAALFNDSTETNVTEGTLKLHGGKPMINPMNCNEGARAASDCMILAPTLRRSRDRANH